MPREMSLYRQLLRCNLTIGPVKAFSMEEGHEFCLMRPWNREQAEVLERITQRYNPHTKEWEDIDPYSEMECDGCGLPLEEGHIDREPCYCDAEGCTDGPFCMDCVSTCFDCERNFCRCCGHFANHNCPVPPERSAYTHE